MEEESTSRSGTSGTSNNNNETVEAATTASTDVSLSEEEGSGLAAPLLTEDERQDAGGDTAPNNKKMNCAMTPARVQSLVLVVLFVSSTVYQVYAGLRVALFDVESCLRKTTLDIAEGLVRCVEGPLVGTTKGIFILKAITGTGRTGKRIKLGKWVRSRQRIDWITTLALKRFRLTEHIAVGVNCTRIIAGVK